MQSQDWTEAQSGKIAGAVAVAGDLWLSHLAGLPDLRQIAVTCAQGFPDFRRDARGWRRGNDMLAAWQPVSLNVLSPRTQRPGIALRVCLHAPARQVWGACLNAPARGACLNAPPGIRS